MFHHFHGGVHLPAQGSLSSSDLEDLINWLDDNYSLLGAKEYRRKFDEGELCKGDICLSFDDALKCQIDIAVPVLREKKIDAFFLLYSSALTENPDLIEIYRYFRTAMFETIEDFYDAFLDRVRSQHGALLAKHEMLYEHLNYLPGRPYYSHSDKWFRYIRDQVINKSDYDQIMQKMMADRKFDTKAVKEILWMDEHDIKSLIDDDHTIGLHSFSHPTQISKLSKAEQFSEYHKNKIHLEQVTGLSLDVMSHPCGDYNAHTLEVLKSLGIKMGFCANLLAGKQGSAYEIPRENHSNVFREMKL